MVSADYESGLFVLLTKQKGLNSSQDRKTTDVAKVQESKRGSVN
jgi:hypothetical protein